MLVVATIGLTLVSGVLYIIKNIHVLGEGK